MPFHMGFNTPKAKSLNWLLRLIHSRYVYSCEFACLGNHCYPVDALRVQTFANPVSVDNNN